MSEQLWPEGAQGQIGRVPSGIEGFDFISYGGLPQGRATLVAGTPGSAKTVFATHFLAAGIEQHHEPGVFVTFEETPDDIRANAAGLGFDIPAHEEAGTWTFVDASPAPGDEELFTGSFDLAGLLARVRHAIGRTGATRVAVDGVSALLGRLPDSDAVRSELRRIIWELREMGVTAVVTAERDSDEGELSRHGVEDFVADNVIILRNVRENEKRRRTLELLKFRGTAHQKGEFPFTIMPGQGIVVIPLSAIRLIQSSSKVRISTGIGELDDMTDGGFYRDAIALVSGATGTGKTLMTTHFIGATPQDERALLFAFEESAPQLARNALGWGVDFAKMEEQGCLKVMANYPEVASLEDHLILMKEAVDEYRPTRIALDSISALQRAGSARGFREFILGLTSFLKQEQIAALVTSNTSNLLGGRSVTDAHISTITDLIILLRYVEVQGEMRRGLTVLKMRGSAHDKRIREYIVDDTGMHVGKAFRNVGGILSGNPRQDGMDSEIERMQGLFGAGDQSLDLP